MAKRQDCACARAGRSKHATRIKAARAVRLLESNFRQYAERPSKVTFLSARAHAHAYTKDDHVLEMRRASGSLVPRGGGPGHRLGTQLAKPVCDDCVKRWHSLSS